MRGFFNVDIYPRMDTKVALITGITGQDGSNFIKLLLVKEI